MGGDEVAQVSENAAQITPGAGLGIVTPEEPGQRDAGVWTVLDGQVEQQRPCLARLKTGQGRSSIPDLEPTQSAHFEKFTHFFCSLANFPNVSRTLV